MNDKIHDGHEATNVTPVTEVKPDLWATVEITKANKGRTPRQNLNERRLRAGLCNWCGKPNDRTTYRCKNCTAKVTATNAKKRKERRDRGVCVVCEEPWTGRHMTCAKCRTIASKKMAEKMKLNPEKCQTCDAPRDTRGKRCAACREENRLRVRTHKAAKLAAGLCVQCGKEKHVPGKRTCVKCRLGAEATRNIGSSKFGPLLMEKFISQEMKCFYTGAPIVIGGNASLDHFLPVAKGGTGDMSNLNWVTWEVNRSKNDMTHDEFVSMCHQVASRFPLKPERPCVESVD